MRAILSILIIAITISLGFSTQAQTSSIEDYRWKNRLLIYCSADFDESSDFFRNMAPLNSHGFSDRDVVFIYIEKREADTFAGVDHIREDFLSLAQCNLEVNSLSLIGKDGTLKRKWTKHPTQTEIFRFIDAMPMRQREMRKKDRGWIQ